VVLGAALTVLLEISQPYIRSQKEVERLIASPVLIGIPKLQTASEERFKRIQRTFEWAAGVILASIMAAGNWIAFFRT
jgi:hypothetical protein